MRSVKFSARIYLPAASSQLFNLKLEHRFWSTIIFSAVLIFVILWYILFAPKLGSHLADWASCEDYTGSFFTHGEIEGQERRQVWGWALRQHTQREKAGRKEEEGLSRGRKPFSFSLPHAVCERRAASLPLGERGTRGLPGKVLRQSERKATNTTSTFTIGEELCPLLSPSFLLLPSFSWQMFWGPPE